MKKNDNDKNIIIAILIAMLLCAVILQLTPRKNISWMTDDEFNEYNDEMQEYQLENYLPY